jgi:hypothetical protein
MSVKQPVNDDSTEEIAVFKVITAPKRLEVLSELWSMDKWLKERIETKQTKIDPHFKFRVYMIQIRTHICKTLLYGLKDEELEIRVMELEEKLKNGILIPRQEAKR